MKEIMNISFKKLLELADDNKSIRFYKIINNRKKDLWQIECADNFEYCLKTFYHYKNQKYFFNLKKIDEIDGKIFDKLRRVLLIISEYVKFKEEDKQLIDDSFLEYSDWITFEIFKENYKTTVGNMSKIEYKIFKKRKTVNDKIEKTGENEIRVHLNKYLQEIYPDKLIKEEYTTACLNVRADTVVFTGEYIHTYEIKSDKDTFVRLEEQLKGYKTYSEKITLVIDERKKEELYKGYKHLLDGIGIILYKSDNSILKPIRKAKLDRKQLDNKIKLLWGEEFNYILKVFLKQSEIRKLNKDKKAEFLLGVLNKKQIYKYVNLIITYRNYKNIKDEINKRKKEINIFKVMEECEIDENKIRRTVKRL